MLSPKVLVVIVLAVVTFGHCDVFSNQIRQSRFLGTLNRYYVTSSSLRSDGTNFIDLSNSDAAVSQLSAELLDGTQNVAIVIHGRESSAFSNFGNTLQDSFIKSDDNLVVILVDWPLVASMNYATVVASVPYIADDIISLIGRLENYNKIDRSQVHIVGFDVGAHIAGLVSRDSSTRVQRITGLSPAGESWVGNPQCLKSTDAEYVEIIHTDYTGTNSIGINDIIGTVDFFANFGPYQPGCSDNQCNHDRSWELFAAVLDMGGHLMGLKCENLDALENNLCASGPALALGTNNLFKDGSGIYRVNTGENYPYYA